MVISMSRLDTWLTTIIVGDGEPPRRFPAEASFFSVFYIFPAINGGAAGYYAQHKS
jgi:hypothetical protein